MIVALACAVSVQAQRTDTLKSQELQEVIVAGVRARKNAPFAVANIKKAELSNFSVTGRELPFLFAYTPGVFAWGENGLGTGTAAMRIRGAGGSRINITLDGISLNSPEDQTVFWANMNSYGALMNSVQIQRGIGTSTNGDGAFGGSISLATATPNHQLLNRFIGQSFYLRWCLPRNNHRWISPWYGRKVGLLLWWADIRER